MRRLGLTIQFPSIEFYYTFVFSMLWCVFCMLWWIAPARADQIPPKAPFVAGYVSSLSLNAGENVSFHISSSEESVDIQIARLGTTPTTVWEAKAIKTAVQTIPDRASSHGCKWPASTELVIPANWKSGYYEVTFTASSRPALPVPDSSDSIQRPDNKVAEVAPVAPPLASFKQFFVVRESRPGSTSKILIQLSTHTYNAYTNWGGHSLYAYHDRDDVQGHRVSFERPLISQFENWEGPFVRWAEAAGYTLEYAINSDLEYHPEILSNYNLVLSVGHDEYWSAPMRDNLESYIRKGGNVAFFSGNTCCWQVRSEENGRALTCWKQWANGDPLFRSDKQNLLSTLWSHHLVQRPENQLTGVGFLWGGYHRSHGQWMDGPASYEVHRPDHWLFANTNLKRGDRFGGKDTIVGYECDGCEMEWKEGLPFPTGSDGTPLHFQILGSCPATWAPDDAHWYDRFPKDRVGAAVLGTYTQVGTVITTGSTDWSHGLKGKDPAVEQITRNILDKLSKRELAIE